MADAVDVAHAGEREFFCRNIPLDKVLRGIRFGHAGMARVAVTPRVSQPTVPATPYNGPGRIERAGARAPGVLRTSAVRPG